MIYKCIIKTKVEFFKSPCRRKREGLWDNGRRWGMVCAEREKRELEWKRESASRVEVAWKKRDNSRDRLTAIESERRRRWIVGATTVYIYFHFAAGRRETKKRGKERSVQEEAKRERRSRCTSTILMHNRWEEETTSKKRDDAAKGRRKTGTSTGVVWSKKDRASEKWRVYLLVRARETEEERM